MRDSFPRCFIACIWHSSAVSSTGMLQSPLLLVRTGDKPPPSMALPVMVLQFVNESPSVKACKWRSHDLTFQKQPLVGTSRSKCAVSLVPDVSWAWIEWQLAVLVQIQPCGRSCAFHCRRTCIMLPRGQSLHQRSGRLLTFGLRYACDHTDHLTMHFQSSRD